MKTTKFNSEIEKQLVMLITGKNTSCTVSKRENAAWIKDNYTDQNYSNLWFQISLDYPQIAYGNFSRSEVFYLNKISRKIELLLAITHRPLFEIYKKYLEKAK